MNRNFRFDLIVYYVLIATIILLLGCNRALKNENYNLKNLLHDYDVEWELKEDDK